MALFRGELDENEFRRVFRHVFFEESYEEILLEIDLVGWHKPSEFCEVLDYLSDLKRISIDYFVTKNPFDKDVKITRIATAVEHENKEQLIKSSFDVANVFKELVRRIHSSFQGPIQSGIRVSFIRRGVDGEEYKVIHKFSVGSMLNDTFSRVVWMDIDVDKLLNAMYEDKDTTN